MKKDGSVETMYIAMIGVRGDWPWLRVPAACMISNFATCMHASFYLRQMPSTFHWVHVEPGLPSMQWQGPAQAVENIGFSTLV